MCRCWPCKLCHIGFSVLLAVIAFCSDTTRGDVQVVPRFTDLPSSVSYYVDNAGGPNDTHQLDLVCRAWPPNAKVFLLASQLHTSSVSVWNERGTMAVASSQALHQPTSGMFDNLLPVPQGLGNQRYGVLSAAQIVGLDRQLQNPRDLINHLSLFDAVRARPAAGPNDEVAVMLSVVSMLEARQLEMMRLYCLAATAFGHILSSPFHVVPTSLGDFPQPSTPFSSPTVRTVDVLENNIGVVDCEVPLNSHPNPKVHFELNGTRIVETTSQVDRYRLVWRPNGQRVSLLIHEVQIQDRGTYRCAITNPLTGEKKYAPEVTLLNPISPKKFVSFRFTVSLASNLPANSNGTHETSTKILVEEGQNVTLFCVLQGAPPPTAVTYPFDGNMTAHDRIQRDKKFGLLQITDVRIQDAGVYVCTHRQLTSTVHMHVKPRLRLVTRPEDVRISRLGDQAQFNCSTSDPQVTPFWLFNGEPVNVRTWSGRNNSILLTNVTKKDLGIYQCVAQRKPTDRRLSYEWVSASAILALKSDRMIRTADELAMLTPQRPKSTVETTPEITTDELTPRAQVLYDNLAVYLVWQPLRPELSGLDQSKAVEYRVEYSVQTSPVEERQRGNLNVTETPVALVGLVGHEAVRWSEPMPLKQQTATAFVYITDAVLKPSKRYRFRVIAIDPATGSQGRVYLMWTFDGANGQSPLATSGQNSLSSTSVGNPQPLTATAPTSSLFPSASDSSVFVPDYFLVLARPLVKPKTNSADSFKYGTYWATQFNGSNVREGMLTGLNRSASYQVIVYGVRGTDNNRQITRFSKAAYVNLATADHVGGYSLLKALTSNRLMYLILGGIAALMFFVVLIFILLCLCRQQRDRRLHGQRKKQNGFAHGYKDTNLQYIPVSTTDGSGGGACGQRHSGAGTLSNHGTGAGPGNMLMMNNLQCSAFSEHSNPNTHQMQQQQQQQQQIDQYTAAAMSNEAMLMHQQQHSSVLGSQMHFQAQQQQQQQQTVYHPQHHQSHHSLLFPSGAVLSGPTGAMFQSGTLPGGPRYIRQQSYPTQQQQFSSHQPLNRTTTPATGVDMVDYYHHQQQQQPMPNVYAHQQPQLPPVPHPQTAELPPPYGSVNGVMHHQMVYYPGPTTPSGTSLKREPPTGGSLQDGSSYGTLLQRGQLTGSMIHDPSSALVGGAISPVPGHPGYYHGSQQALHMTQYPNGVGAPQSVNAAMYSPRQSQQIAAFYAQQQQQAQYPNYYGQQLSHHLDAVGQGPHGFGHTDGESIYSYFSQQEVPAPGTHQPLNPLPEENQASGIGCSGYVDSGMQTADFNGQGGIGADGSPAGGGGNHRHHRRRRRKQQQRQTSDQPNGTSTNDSPDGAGEGPSFSEQQSGDTRVEEQRQTYEQETPGQKRHHSLSGAGTYSDADPMSGQQSFTSPQSYHQNSLSAVDPNRSGYMRYDSPQRGGSMSAGQLPPPNQPPPPPPPPAVALGLSSSGGIMNGHPTEHHNVYPNPHLGMHQHPLTSADSLSLRVYPGAPGGYPTSSGASLLVGPPPRVRDYSEYGIPRGIGLPPTPAGGGGQPQPPQHNALMGNLVTSSHHLNGGTNPTMMMTMYDGRYREGQA
ncbi:uncharacterized protein DEA37_0013905 [Paragonimus westermani]|uniref:Ig-like domain-containing protein n=1 Tax=Paragonimus westermani TaxID=34504 RepID=A0A5J4P0Z1_9TREM|nr:uncharacterized protein DEA37_0013905 [Paragonimus westermani]